MTNKELAERKISELTGLYCTCNFEVSELCEFCLKVNKSIAVAESILSEYQGEAVAWKVSKPITCAEDNMTYVYLSQDTKPQVCVEVSCDDLDKIKSIVDIIISAPIKKKCNCYFSEDELKEKAPIKKENDNG